MEICISNLAWLSDENQNIYQLLSDLGVRYLEIAPSIFTGVSHSYDITNQEVKKLQKDLDNFSLKIASMQSIHFGYKNMALFETMNKYNHLFDVSCKAIDFAHMFNIPNIVFGSPKIRIIPSTLDNNMACNIWTKFFTNLAEYAHLKNTVIALEPNSKEYGTNFATNTLDTINIIRHINHSNLQLNLDMGTVILEKEDISILENNFDIINHIHISSPFLKSIYSNPEYAKIYETIIHIAYKNNYKNKISIEMLKDNEINNKKHVMQALILLQELMGVHNG